MKWDLEAVLVESASLPEHHTMAFPPSHTPLMWMKYRFFKKGTLSNFNQPMVQFSQLQSLFLGFCSASGGGKESRLQTNSCFMKMLGQQASFWATKTPGQKIIRREFCQLCKTDCKQERPTKQLLGPSSASVPWLPCPSVPRRDGQGGQAQPATPLWEVQAKRTQNCSLKPLWNLWNCWSCAFANSSLHLSHGDTKRSCQWDRNPCMRAKLLQSCPTP